MGPNDDDDDGSKCSDNMCCVLGSKHAAPWRTSVDSKACAHAALVILAVLQSTPIHTDFETLRAIPQSDRTSKMRAYEILHALRSEYQAITFSTYGLTDDYIFDLTSEEHFAWKPLFANLASVLEITKDNQIINVSLVLQSTEHITVQISFVQAPDRPRLLHLLPRCREGILREVKAIVE